MRRRCPKCGGTICRVGNGEHPYYCKNCMARFTEPEVEVPRTNADRIRAMTDKDLAKHLCCPWEICKNMDVECDKCLLDWLQQEEGE